MMYAKQKAPTAQATPTLEAPSVSAEPSMGMAAEGDFTAQFSTGGHRDVGDSVEGASVDVNGVWFTPGEINALVDFVGTVDELFAYPAAILYQMKALIVSGCEDARIWDSLTDGGYTKLAQDNECHFAPSATPGGGADFRSAFIALHAQALTLMRQAEEAPEGPEQDALIARARATAYSAEHFLQDAFSAGHQVGGGDVENAVDDAMIEGALALPELGALVGAMVWAENQATIECYGLVGMGPLTLEQFILVAVGGSKLQGIDGVYDAVRKAVHEELAEGGVEVASKAHPEPWLLPGDEDLASSPETYRAIQQALSMGRTQLEDDLAPGVDPVVTATKLFDLHAPTPTSAGAAKVAATLTAATENFGALACSVSTAMSMEIVAVLDAAAATSKGVLRRLKDPVGEEEEEARSEPGIPDYVKPRGFGDSVIYRGRAA